MLNEDGNVQRYFAKLVVLWVDHFQSIYREQENVNMEATLKIVSSFHSLVLEEDIQMLNEEVSIEELIVAMSSFKKDKSLGLYR